MRALPKWLLAALLAPIACAQSLGPELYSGLRWRMIGPFRGGRTVAASGVPGQPNVFYIAANNGGVWKSTDAGRVWKPIFDDQATGSIGALAVAPSDPRIIYVGSGEGLQRPDLSVGDGIYKSTDAGQSWQHLGLRDAQQISAIIVDPHDSKRVFAAVLGHPYGPNAERGVFRSTDGGATWQKVLYKDENTGAVDLAFDPSNAQTVYAVLWAARQAPWEIGESFKPGQRAVQIHRRRQHLAAARRRTAHRRRRLGPHRHRHRAQRSAPHVRAGGRHAARRRLPLRRRGRQLAAHQPRRARLGARLRFRGRARGSQRQGRHLHRQHFHLPLDGRRREFHGHQRRARRRRLSHHLDQPRRPQHHLLASDQGATISLNGGETWSSWYNQPTAQFYHVITDNRFPYWVYGGQQESGSVGTASRGDYGGINFRDWHPVGVEEYGYVAPDPLHPGIDLRRQGDALRPGHRRGAGRGAVAGPARRQVPLRAHHAAAVFAGRSAHFVSRLAVLLRTVMAASHGKRSVPT
jgi:hypothetical protein